MALPIIGSEDFPQEVRITPDGRVSVYDGIGYLLGNKNPYQVWNDLIERIPEVLHKTENFQFPGKGQTIIALEEALVSRSPSKTLEPFVGQLLTLVTSNESTRSEVESLRAFSRRVKTSKRDLSRCVGC